MAQESLQPTPLGGWANWPFTNIFRTFRLAIHPSKLALALAAVLICYMAGRFLDLLAGKRVVVEQPVVAMRLPADEINQYLNAEDIRQFRRWREAAIHRNRQKIISYLVMLMNKDADDAAQLVDDGEALDQLRQKHRSLLRDAEETLEKRYDQAKNIAKAEYETALKTASDKQQVEQQYKDRLARIDQAYSYLQVAMRRGTAVAARLSELKVGDSVKTVVLPDPNKRDQAKQRDLRKVSDDRQELTRTVQFADAVYEVKGLQGLGVFQAALSYGILMFNSAVNSVLAVEFFFNENFQGFTGETVAPPGLARTLGLAIVGLGWFARVHWLYFIIYGLICVAVWSVAGGAICRIAALHAARDEKIPWKEAVQFATKKFICFFTAPLMPVGFIAACCIPLLVYGLIGAIPVVGELVAGLGFGVALVIAFIQTLLIVGALAGLGLLFPTIAVEGSDAFDAFSRSYTYIYQRPWRTIFYTVVAAVYGTLCFVFVKLFVTVLFTLTHKVVGLAMNLDSASRTVGLGKLDAMWSGPSGSGTGPFFGRFFVYPLNWSESLGAFFTAVWVFLMVGLVIAFAISFFFCGYTWIYLLLRRVVDATEFDEVYAEEFEPAPAAPEAPSAPAPEQPAEEQPPAPEQPPAEQQEQTPPQEEQPPEQQQGPEES